MQEEIMNQTTESKEEELFTFEELNERASQGKRFINYIIDSISFYVFSFLLGLLIGLVYPELFNYNDDPLNNFLERVFSLFLYGLYIGTMEGLFKGKTLGKVFTQTKTVSIDGSTINFNTGLLRGLSKAVPFCAFSALSKPCIPWQDRWTDTMVIVEKD